MVKKKGVTSRKRLGICVKGPETKAENTPQRNRETRQLQKKGEKKWQGKRGVRREKKKLTVQGDQGREKKSSGGRKNQKLLQNPKCLKRKFKLDHKLGGRFVNLWVKASSKESRKNARKPVKEKKAFQKRRGRGWGGKVPRESPKKRGGTFDWRIRKAGEKN